MIKGELISCRFTLWCLFFTGCVVNYMLKICLNLAIVAMVVPRITKHAHSQCISYDLNTTIQPKFSNISDHIIDHNISSISAKLPLNVSYDGRFKWTEYEQGLALGAFYWSYWSTNVPGGLLAQHYGTKIVFGGSNFLACLIVLLIPVTIRYHLYAFLVLRVFQGIVMGVALPSMHAMTAKWIPPNERSKFVSAYMGGSIGTAFVYFLSAIIIYYLNWESAFYATSVIGIIWYCFWLYFAYDSPEQHPRISKSEMKYISEGIPKTGTNSGKSPLKVPWAKILTSMPVWAAVIGNWGATWGYYTLLAQGPTYFSFIHGWNINMAGTIAGAPHILLMIFSYQFGVLCDWLLKNDKMSRTSVRKFAVLVTNGLQALFLIGLSLSGCHRNLAVFFMIVGTLMSGGSSSGTLSNYVDLSPNYGSVLLGISGLVSNSAGAISPLIVGILTNDNQTIGQWRLVFLISAGCLTGSAIIYMIWGTAEEQPWNNLNEYENNNNSEELQMLKSSQQFQVTECKTEKEVETIPQ